MAKSQGVAALLPAGLYVSAVVRFWFLARHGRRTDRVTGGFSSRYRMGGEVFRTQAEELAALVGWTGQPNDNF